MRRLRLIAAFGQEWDPSFVVCFDKMLVTALRFSIKYILKVDFTDVKVMRLRCPSENVRFIASFGIGVLTAI
jgi:hypothetical protein